MTATIKDFVSQYLNATIIGIEGAYHDIIGAGASAVTWAGSTLGSTTLEKQGYFGSGDWVDSNHTQSVTTDMYSDLSRIFTYKAVK